MILWPTDFWTVEHWTATYWGGASFSFDPGAGYWPEDYWVEGYWPLEYWGAIDAASFRLYDVGAGTLLRTLDGSEPFACDLTNILPAGQWVIGLTRVDQYGSESEMARFAIEIDGAGDAARQLVFPTLVRARPLAGGQVELRWISANTTDQLDPTEFEIADQTELATILRTVAAQGQRSFETTLGPFSRGATVALAVRASNGASQRGTWALSDAVVADNEAPPAPVVIVGPS